MLGIERLRPTRGINRSSAFGDFDDMVNRFFEGSLSPQLWNSQAWVPTCDLTETENEIRILMDLPGMNKENVDIQLNEGTLVIRGERKFEEQEKTRYHRLERFNGSFTRSFELPASIEAEKISAVFKDGVLEVVLPKKESAKTRKITIQAE